MNIALCDDHELVADGITLLLKALAPEIKVERHSTAKELLQAALAWDSMDLVLLDLGLPDLYGMLVLKQLRALREDVPVVVISGVVERGIILEAIDNGAMGFVPKTSSSAKMLDALKVVLNGDVYLPHLPDSPATNRQHGSVSLNLTPKQWQILRCILEGKPIKRISSKLNIAESTVKSHITPILRELGVTSRTEAIVRVAQMGIKIPKMTSADN